MQVWEVPEKYICGHAITGMNSPCWQDEEVICWVARPKEKTIIVRYMLAMQLLSIALTTLELAYFSCKWSMRFHLPERQRPKISRKVTDFHRYIKYDKRVIRRRANPKSEWSEPYPATCTEELLLPPSAPLSVKSSPEERPKKNPEKVVREDHSILP